MKKKKFIMSDELKEYINSSLYPELLYYDLSKTDQAIVIAFYQRVSPEIRPFRIIGKPPHQELIGWQPWLTYDVINRPVKALIVSFQEKRYFLTINTSFYYDKEVEPRVPKGYFEYVVNLYSFGQNPAQEAECEFGILFKQHKKDLETASFSKTRLRH